MQTQQSLMSQLFMILTDQPHLIASYIDDQLTGTYLSSTSYKPLQTLRWKFDSTPQYESPMNKNGVGSDSKLKPPILNPLFQT